MKNIHRIEPTYYRSIFISDVHLGFPGCSAGYLLDFLRSTRCDYLYLVGDIIDIWQMKRKLHWPQAHNDVIRTLLGKAKHGTRIIYVTGNHDELLRDFSGMSFGNLTLVDEAIHETRCGKRFLVIHGDQFDGVVTNSKMLALLGSALYEVLLKANTWVNVIRRRCGLSYWSLSNMLKHQVKEAVKYISNFEAALVHEAMTHGVDGVISGHIHRAEITRLDNMVYCNCGDWVESCTALVETHQGSMELLHWTDKQHSIKQHDLVA
jgi:UDP-2,3-diacylglucosamine pyrophosphatase LpxH